jgi:rubrerythrin
MDLATFGAILSYAMEFEEQAAEFYASAAKGDLEEIFTDLERSSRKRAKRMERTRREGVAEMILEPIMDLNGNDYQTELSVDAGEQILLERAITLEATSARFYQDAAEKLPIRDVVRTFTRMAKENEKRKTRLEAMNLGS